MDGFTGFNGNGSGEVLQHFSNGQSLNLTFGNMLPHENELLMQQHISQTQLLSPSTHQQRHDSMFGISPATTPKSAVSPHQHQAELQPYFTTAQMTPHGYPPRPVNMSRSKSQVSNKPTGNRQQHSNHRHRASCSNVAQSGTTSMSRSPTQYSAPPMTQPQYQAAPQPRETEAQLNYDNLYFSGPTEMPPLNASFANSYYPEFDDDVSSTFNSGNSNDLKRSLSRARPANGQIRKESFQMSPLNQ
jgi:hypothetical protein